MRLWGLALIVSGLVGVWAQVAWADDPAATIYEPGQMSVIKLTLPQKSREGLAADRDKYQPGTFSLAETDGTPGGEGAFSTPVNVKIKLKGSASYRPLSEKSAFKIKFEEAPFRGLKYITLNNMVEDPSMIHETLAYTAFRGAGVPASRTGYAYVYVDGEDYGVHLNIEALDGVALAKRFGSFDDATQHLYEGEDGHDAYPGGAGQFEIDEGGDDRSDLEALVEAVNSNGSSSWASRVAAVIDLQEMTRMWAVEKYIGQWDGYAGRNGETWLPNNYYLYSDPSGKFQMLPWGNDESWQMAYRLPFDGRAGLMFNHCLDDVTCAALYRESVAAVRQAIGGMDLDALAVSSAALLAPWQQMEQEDSTREEHNIEEIQKKVAEARAFIAARPGDVAEWLGERSPPGSVVSTLIPPPPHLSIGFAPSRFKVGRAWVKGGVLRVRGQSRAKGVVTLRATIPTSKGAAVVCRDRIRVRRAGRLTLRCRLATVVRARLRQGRLSLAIAIRFLSPGESPESVTRQIVLSPG
jgi:hypothetical protein